jgi:hypothetical protein
LPEFLSGLKTSPTAFASQSARLSRTGFFIVSRFYCVKGIEKKDIVRIAPDRFS